MDQKLLDLFKKLGNLYTILGIEPTDDKKAIKKAYKTQSLLLHPDKNPSPNASMTILRLIFIILDEEFHRLQQAYNVLSDPQQKEQYDKYLKNQKYHEERVQGISKERKKFAEELNRREKEEEMRREEEQKKQASKEEKRQMENVYRLH